MTPRSAWSFGAIAGPVDCDECRGFIPPLDCLGCKGSGVAGCCYCGNEPGIHQDHDGLSCAECFEARLDEIANDERAAA